MPGRGIFFQISQFFFYPPSFSLPFLYRGKKYISEKKNWGLPTGHYHCHPLDRKQTFFKGGPMYLKVLPSGQGHLFTALSISNPSHDQRGQPSNRAGTELLFININMINHPLLHPFYWGAALAPILVNTNTNINYLPLTIVLPVYVSG